MKPRTMIRQRVDEKFLLKEDPIRWWALSGFISAMVGFWGLVKLCLWFLANKPPEERLPPGRPHHHGGHHDDYDHDGGDDGDDGGEG